jgi:hypothetical protein
MKWKIVTFLIVIVALSLLYLHCSKIYENYEDDYSVTNDPKWHYTASNNEPISCDNFCRKVGLTNITNCRKFNTDIHMRCLNSNGVLAIPNCVHDDIKNKCVFIA